MELEVKPYHKNLFPLVGVLIKGASVAVWLTEIQGLKLTLPEITAYPIPDVRPNSVWGCLLITSKKIPAIGRHEYCQLVYQTLFIPEKSVLYPAVSEAELKQLCYTGLHIVHPEFGMVALDAELNWEELLQEPVCRDIPVLSPAASVFIPTQISSFQVAPVSTEEILKKLEGNLEPRKESLAEKPLSLWEKGKLSILRQLLSRRSSRQQAGKDTGSSGGLPAGSGGMGGAGGFGGISILGALLGWLFSGGRTWATNLQVDYEELERRNQKEIDKLLNLLKTNPTEALKYALPLDEQRTSRGGETGQFQLWERWFNFSLFGGGGSTSGGSGSINIGDKYQLLRDQYQLSAQDLIKQGDYYKAAFIYLKLLKDHQKAAQTLETGKYYAEAASVYLKYSANKPKAAECYEKGRMTLEAIDLYKELNEHEKVGDLYTSINNRQEATIYYEKVIDDYKSRHQYLKASFIYKNKMNDVRSGQDLLLEGWRLNADAYNCLNNYFANIPDTKILGQELARIYKQHTNDQNCQTFLQVIRHEYDGHPEIAGQVRSIAYEIIAAQIPQNNDIVSELRYFNAPDKELVKDTIRFKAGKRKN